VAENANAGIERGQVLHGARVYLTANGRRVGYCTSISIQKATNQADVDCLDDILTTEHVPVGVTFSGTLEALVVVGRSLIAAGITVALENALNRVPLNLAAVDRVSGKVIVSARRVALTGSNFDIRKGALTAQRMSFKCIDMVNENGVVEI